MRGPKPYPKVLLIVDGAFAEVLSDPSARKTPPVDPFQTTWDTAPSKVEKKEVLLHAKANIVTELLRGQLLDQRGVHGGHLAATTASVYHEHVQGEPHLAIQQRTSVHCCNAPTRA